MSEEIKVGDRVEFFAEDQLVESGVGTAEVICHSGVYVRTDKGLQVYVVTVPGSRYTHDFVRKVEFSSTVTAVDVENGVVTFGPVVSHDPKDGPPPNPKKAFGAQKPDLALVPPASTLHEAMALEAGARKYGPFNWRKDPVESMTYIAAAMRHIQNYLDGEEYCADDATVHNLGAAKAGLGILLDAMELGNLIDNRPPKGPSSQVQERMKAQKVEAKK